MNKLLVWKEERRWVIVEQLVAVSPNTGETYRLHCSRGDAATWELAMAQVRWLLQHERAA